MRIGLGVDRESCRVAERAMLASLGLLVLTLVVLVAGVATGAL